MKNKGWILYEKAQKILPGATQLFGKRAELFAPEAWPSYFSSAKGCTVFDLEGKKFLDFTMVGIGTSVLGYADDDINTAVIDAIQNGNLTTLNAKVEVDLAEELLKIHPWADMVKYSRGGGEMLSVAIRIARAATRKEKILFCGYHGWHDWYLSANLTSPNSLKDHLLSDISIAGLPLGLKNSVTSFQFNDKNSFLNVYNKYKNDIAAIIIEPYRDNGPQEEFLSILRDCSNKSNSVLIFDEVTSGFRECLGGMHLRQTIMPDLVTYGKAISNGFPMAALVGRRKIMEKALDTFISSTYWTDRIGPTAALATIKKQEKIQAGQQIIKIGEQIKSILNNSANSSNLGINIVGMPSLLTFKLGVDDWPAALTFYIQEMLKKGFLASDRVYANIAHTQDKLDEFASATQSVFSNLSVAIKNNSLRDKLDGPVKQMGISKVNS